MENGLLLTMKLLNRRPAPTEKIIMPMGVRRRKWNAFVIQSVTYSRNNESGGNYVDPYGGI